jgi:serine phosphatase RsbU (regulator of sigma subunit)
MNIRSAYFYFFMIYGHVLFAQANVDSLNRFITASKEDTVKMEALIKLQRALKLSYPDSAYTRNQELQKLAIQLQNKRGEGISYENNGNYYNGKGNYAEALKWFLKAAKVYEEAGLKKEMGITLNSIGNTYLGINNTVKALEYFMLSRNMASSINNNYQVAIANVGISSVLSRQMNFRGALQALFEARTHFTSAHSEYPLGVVLANIGEAYASMQEFDSAGYYFDQSLVINRKLKNNYAVYSTLLSKGNVLQQQNKHKEALVLFQQSLQMCQAENARAVESTIYKAISDSYKGMNNYESAYSNYVKHIGLKDSIFNAENNRQLLDIQTKYETGKKDNEIKILNQQQEIQKNSLNRQRSVIWIGIIGFLIILAVSLLQYRNSVRNKRFNKILEHQKNIIQEKNKNITDSIRYAKKIQEVVLPEAMLLNTYRKPHFLFHQPKDIVSGDFYWTSQKGNKFYFAVCDSTGHGVPGAFMSLLNIGFLNEALNEKGLEQCNEIFDFVRQRLIENVGKEAQKDGFDGILLCFNQTDSSVTYAAANNAPFLVSKDKALLLEKDRMPVGYGMREDSFNLFHIEFSPGDYLYLFTDGFADQFGGETGKKFKYKPLLDLLSANALLPPETQKQLLSDVFDRWKGPLEQVDDVLIIGISL